MKKVLLLIAFVFSIQTISAQLKVTFPAKDGLKVTADWYPVSSDLPVILLCHQNNSSRGEYSETALRSDSIVWQWTKELAKQLTVLQMKLQMLQKQRICNQYLKMLSKTLSQRLIFYLKNIKNQ